MGSAKGAGAGADMLQEVLTRKLREQIAHAEQAQRQAALTEQAREADMGHSLGVRSADQRDADLGFRKERAGVADTQYADAAPLRIANVAHITAQTGDIQRKPQAEQAGRDFTTNRDKAQHGYQMQEIGAQGANALKVANVRHPDTAGTAAAQNEQNDIEDSIALIQQIRDDKARPTATGPIQGGLGVGMLQDPTGYTRVKALHDNLVNKLSLAQAGKLKGQGTVSNFERDMLTKAATALNRGLGDQDYLNELDKVDAYFKRKRGGGVSTQGAGNISAAQEFDYVPGKGLVPRKQ